MSMRTLGSRRIRWVASLWLLAGGGAAAATPPAALRIEAPFSALHCERAIDFAGRRLVDAPSPARRRLLAEGQLCRGLSDDAWALETAIGLLRRAVADQPADIFARVALADALCARYPASAAAQTALRAALAHLADADVGAARVRLTERLTENLAAVRGQRRALAAWRAAGLAGSGRGAGDAGESERLAEHAARVGQAGAAAARREIGALQAQLAARPDDAVVRLQLAELLRGRAPAGAVRMQYAAARPAVCGGEGAGGALPDGARCALVRWRLEQLDAQVRAGADR